MGSGYRKRGLWIEVMEGGLCTSHDEVTRVNAFMASRTGKEVPQEARKPFGVPTWRKYDYSNNERHLSHNI
jgi:hypothetical protein